jgi:hypothetical protein
MNHVLQNPFNFAGAEPSPTGAAVAHNAHSPDAAASPYDSEFDPASPSGDLSLRELVDRGFDVQAFLADLEEAPLFLRIPVRERL